MTANLGQTLLIANPVSRAGRGAEAAREAHALLCREGLCESLELVFTQGSAHATHLAAGSSGYDTVAVVGGDGVLNHVANGLMRIERGGRPALAAIPFGSGNDYASTLGIPANNPARSVKALASASPKALDVGLVNGTYFVETFSFGLDAEIGLESGRRQAQNGRAGTALYGGTGVDLFLNKRIPYAFRATLRGPGGDERELVGKTLIFAVQVGPTYGGGFRICPDASPLDGTLDVCHTLAVPGAVRTLGIFALARLGLHRLSRDVVFERACGLHVECDVEPPAQTDGEPLAGRVFDITCAPGALDVYCPAGRG